MNKNTLTGLLLMGAVIMVFMYLNKPTQEEIEQQRRLQEQQQEQLDQKAEAQALPADSISPAEAATIAQTVRQNGAYDAQTATYTLIDGGVKLTAADSVQTASGTVDVDGSMVEVASLLKPVTTDTQTQALALIRQTIDNSARYGGFARYLSADTAQAQAVVLHNDVLALTITSRGAVIENAELLNKKYCRYDSTQVCPIATGDDSYGFILSAGDTQYDTRRLYFQPTEVTDSSVLMTVTPGDGVMLGIRYTLPQGENYTVGMELVQKSMDVVIPPSASNMEFVWSQKMARNEAGRVFESDNSAIYYMSLGGDVDNLSERSDADKNVQNPLQWVAFKNQFFSTVLIATEGFKSANMESKVLKDDPNFLKTMDMTAKMDYSSALKTPAALTFFIGPNSYPLLSDLSDQIVADKDLKLTKLIPLGWSLFRWINTWIVIPVFDFLGKYIANYGIIILLLTIFIKLLLFPFTYKSYMSQAKMRVLAPEIKEINEKYPGTENAMRRQQETMALYSRAGANPMSGCLPMLLQLPILIAMFRFFPSAIELRGEAFLWAHDLSAPDAIIPLPFSIPMLGDKLSLFCILMTVVNIIYTRINLQNQPGGQQMPGMKWMMYLMPVMFLVFFNNYAAGLSYYYLLSLLITIIQTYVFRKIVSEEKVRATMKANAAKPKKKSGFMARLEEAQRRQQAMLREQEKQRKGKGGKR